MTDLIHTISGASGAPIAVDRRPALNDRLQHRISNSTSRNRRSKQATPRKAMTEIVSISRP